jgi:hypothetical protein
MRAFAFRRLLRWLAGNAIDVEEVELHARVIFRSPRVALLETEEPPAQRFTVLLDGEPLAADAVVQISSLWRHPSSAATIRRLRWGNVGYDFDARGRIHRDGQPRAPATPQPLPLVEGWERCARCGGSIDPPDLVFTFADGVPGAPYWHPGCVSSPPPAPASRP